MSVRRRLVVALFVVAAALLHAAGPALATSAVKAPPVPDGYVSTPIKAAGFTIAIPETWLALDPKSSASLATLEATAERNPQLSSSIEQFKSMRSSIKFWAVDAGGTSYASNMLVLPTPFDRSIVKRPATIEASLKSALGDSVESLSAHKVRLAGVGAVEADATLTINSPAGTPMTVYATIYFLPTKKGLVDIDFSSDKPADSDTTLQTMIKSLRLL
jgi:hypothetical protein